MHFGEIGVDRKQALIHGDGAIKLVCLVQGDGESEERFGRIAIEAERLLECGNRVGVLVDRQEHLAAAAVVAPFVRIDLDGAVDQGDRLLGVAGLAGEQAQPMVGVGLIGMLGDDLAIDRLGVGQTPSQMMLHRRIKPLANVVRQSRFDTPLTSVLRRILR